MDACVGRSDMDYEIVLVTGVCRSGKSWFSRMLGSAYNAEWLCEPVGLRIPIRWAALQKIEFQFAKKMIKRICDEIVYERILLRNANFRPQDMSSIFSYKTMETIFDRMVTIQTRDDVREYLQKKRTVIVLDIPDLLPYIEFMRQVFPSIKVIHIVRNGFSVAHQVNEKGWYCVKNLTRNNLRDPLYKRCLLDMKEEYFIPYWLHEKKGKEFILTTDYGRAIMYWSNMLDSCSSKKNIVDMEIRYEDFVSEPNRLLNEIGDMLKLRWTAKTEEIKSMLDLQYSSDCSRELTDVSASEQNLFYEQMRRYNYG